MESRICLRCQRRFEPADRFADRQRVCAVCVLRAIDEMALESIEHMTEEEIEAELREDGVDVEAFRKLLFATLDKIRGGESR